MRAGDLKRRGVLQQRDTGRSPEGGLVTTWTTLFPLWMQIEALSAREMLLAQSMHSEVTHKITTRYRSELASPQTVATYRIVYKGRNFNISGAMNVDEGNHTVELMASEGLNDG